MSKLAFGVEGGLPKFTLGRRAGLTQMVTASDSEERHGALHETRPREVRVPVLFQLVPVAHMGSLVTFGVLRAHQNNPYTDWSTGFLLSAGALWFLGGAWTVIRARRQQRVPTLVVAWLVLATLLVLVFFTGMMAFLFP